MTHYKPPYDYGVLRPSARFLLRDPSTVGDVFSKGENGLLIPKGVQLYAPGLARLYGVLNEVFDDNAAFRELIDDAANTSRLAKAHQAARDACGRIRSALSDDEHVLADCMRHAQAHVIQDAFDLRPSMKGNVLAGVKERHRVPSLDRVFSVDEMRDCLKRLPVWKTVTERDYATVIARRLLPHVRDMCLLMRRVNDVP